MNLVNLPEYILPKAYEGKEMKAKTATEHAEQHISRIGRSIGSFGANDPALTFGNERIAWDLPPNPGQPLIDVAHYSLSAATKSVRELSSRIRDFESRLIGNQAVMITIISGPAGMALFPERVIAVDPDKIIFEGFDKDRQPFIVIQHVSQLNFAIKSAPLPENMKRHPIGFKID